MLWQRLMINFFQDPILSNSFDAIVMIDDIGNVLEINRAAAQLLNIDHCKSEITIWDFVDNKKITCYKTAWHAFVNNTEIVTSKLLLSVSSTKLLVNVRAVPHIKKHYHCLYISKIDVTFDALAELELNHPRYRRIIDDSPVGIFHTDTEGNDLYINKKAEVLMGLSYNDAMGKGWEKSLHPEDRWVIGAWYNAANTNKNISLEYRFLHPDGKIVWVKGESAFKYDIDGHHVGYIGTLTDITKLHDTEEKLRQSQIEIAHYARVNAMGEMVSGIAHELNQPLTAIVNYATGCIRRLEKHDIDAEIMNSIKHIAGQAHRAGEIIHHLKDFLRKSEPITSDCDINKCIQNVINIIRPIAKTAAIDLQVKSALSNELIITADNIGIEQVLINLLQNAIEAFADYPKKCKKIWVTSSFKKQCIAITVKDNGPGLNQQTENNIFNPFITTKKQGMGIGLSISRNIIDMHKGQLYYRPVKPHGCLFTIILPYKRQHNDKK